MAADRVAYEPLRHVRAAIRQTPRMSTLAVPFEKAAAWMSVQRWRPNLVWANAGLSAPFVFASIRCGIPTVFHIHETGRTLEGILDRYGAPPADAGTLLTFVACSETAGTDLESLTARKAIVIPSRPDLTRWRGLSGEPAMPAEVVAVGTHGHQKGADIFAEAAAIVRATPGHEQTRFRWVGRHATAIARVGDVELVGELEDVRPLVAGATIVAQPSREDAFPLSVVEAMAAARPIVASAVGGIPAQLGDTGVLIPPEDPVALATAIVNLLDDPLRRESLGQAARRRALEHFDASAMHDEIRHVAGAILCPHIRPAQ